MLSSSNITDPTPYLPEPAGSGYLVVGAKGEAIAPDALDRLEQLDDTVFAALNGDAHALDELAIRWREALRSVDAALVAESKQEYVRQARSAWKRSVKQPASRLASGFAALELLELLDETDAA